MPWYKKFHMLWKITPWDLKLDLIGEFLFNPEAFEARYEEEQKFQDALKNMDQRSREKQPQ